MCPVVCEEAHVRNGGVLLLCQPHLGIEGNLAVLVKITDLFLGVRGKPWVVSDKQCLGFS